VERYKNNMGKKRKFSDQPRQGTVGKKKNVKKLGVSVSSNSDNYILVDKSSGEVSNTLQACLRNFPKICLKICPKI
jgi:hypothetical protein